MKLLLVALLAIVATAESLYCEPNSSFKVGCNTCQCTNDGKDALCTRKFCNPKIWNEDGSRKHVTTERTGEIEYDMILPMCTPHTRVTQYETDCNTCTCSSDGRSALCTTMDCDPSVWNEDGTIKDDFKSLSAEESKLTNTDVMCEPLSTFKDYCNACRCSSNGKNAHCTMMTCDLSFWNKDGTPKAPKEDLKKPKWSETENLCKTVIIDSASQKTVTYCL